MVMLKFQEKGSLKPAVLLFIPGAYLNWYPGVNTNVNSWHLVLLPIKPPE